MKIQTLIIDDETACRDTLRNYLEKYCADVQILGEAQDVPSAIELIKSTKPDLVFLDVEMPFGNAFDVLEATSVQDYEAIFVTAFSEYAIKALNFSASYYLLKPVDIDELVKAVDKVKLQMLHHRSQGPTRLLMDHVKAGMADQKLVLPMSNGFDVVTLKDIVNLEGGGNYTDIYLKDNRKKTVTRVLKHFEDILEGKGFMRVHKSHIVNLDCIASYNRGRGGSLILSNGREVEVSPAKKEELMHLFQ
ncbi:MAG: response regulator transcription factor [Bacteroidetes bacterium]|nr:response regulator transcription factor [Bacteroidota bacterium]